VANITYIPTGEGWLYLSVVLYLFSRRIVTDTLGLLLAVLVRRADIKDSQRAPHLLDRALPLPAGGLRRRGLRWDTCGPHLARVRGRWSLMRRERPGFVVLPKQWVDRIDHDPEQAFAWFGGYRRLSKDYERLCTTSEAMVELSAIRLMLRRLA
jgi:putative transposase